MGLKIDENYTGVVGTVIEQQDEAATAMAEQGMGRPWLNFGEDALVTTPATAKEEAQLHDVFTRDDLNETYVAARQDSEAKSQVTAVAKISGDFLAACERDKRMQWRSRIRMFAHAASRCAGNGADNGPIQRNTVDYLSRMFMKSREEEKKP